MELELDEAIYRIWFSEWYDAALSFTANLAGYLVRELYIPAAYLEVLVAVRYPVPTIPDPPPKSYRCRCTLSFFPFFPGGAADGRQIWSGRSSSPSRAPRRVLIEHLVAHSLALTLIRFLRIRIRVLFALPSDLA